ncbi:MAG: TIGR03746 family integrating conjugative element protein [Gammaproteobacteria bacterium]|nr:TIGR03746 family integrating conjugative element protein [Gammaproteobacteria bacterium]
MFERFRKRGKERKTSGRPDDAGIAGDVNMGIAESGGAAAEENNARGRGFRHGPGPGLRHDPGVAADPEKIPGLEMLPGRHMGLGYVQTLQTVMTVNRALLVLLLAAIAVIVVLGIALMSSREWITVYVPPDTTRGAVLTAGVPQHATVYGFAWQTLQALNHWPVDGEKDYPEAIARQTPYLSADMRRGLLQNMNELKNRFGINELKDRTRALHPLGEALFSPARVRRTADGVWGVQVDARLVETVETVPVKDIVIRYRLRVVRTKVDPRGNAWGLMLDGFLEPPERIGETAVEPTASIGIGRPRVHGMVTEESLQKSFNTRGAVTQIAHFLIQPSNVVLQVPLQVVQVEQDADEHRRSDPGVQGFNVVVAGCRVPTDSITGFSGGRS